jgi:hypothetical protein
MAKPSKFRWFKRMGLSGWFSKGIQLMALQVVTQPQKILYTVTFLRNKKMTKTT